MPRSSTRSRECPTPWHSAGRHETLLCLSDTEAGQVASLRAAQDLAVILVACEMNRCSLSSCVNAIPSIMEL